MSIKLLLGSLILAFSLFFSASPALAGGGGVDTRVWNTDDPHQNIVKVYFNPKLYTCKGMVISFKFENPEDGDKISGENGDNSTTITDEASTEIVNGKPYLRCSGYAKVFSGTLNLNRFLNISFKGQNLESSKIIAVSFGIKYNPDRDIPLLPWEDSDNPQPTISPVQKPSTPPAIISPSPTGENKQVDELNKKVNDLQNQLDQSKKTQSVLEQRISNLVDFIKRLFPFFK